NFNEDKRWGVDFQMEYRQRTGQVDWRLGVSGIYHETEALKRAENYSDAYQNRTGKPIDALWGLESNGFFVDQTAIDAAARSSFGEVKPGDISYVDQNKDGIIDSKDEIYLGKGGWSGAPLTMGVNLAAKWKSFTLSAVATGRFGAHGMKNSNYYWVYGDRKYSEVVRGRWTEATSEVATYPRLTTQGGDNNFRASDFWLYKADRFDLSRVQVSYDLPAPILQNSRIEKLGVYVSGFNLLTVAPERDMMEMNVGAAPQTRFYNVGLKAEF
ncbi:MAG: SusC/RagA family TonB-linked outer membrane protein, partial [Bacteroidales bacterium]|nr:SusC/RagA family TonB-linked outer membrane protein [Bacteroidales bacterium]